MHELTEFNFADIWEAVVDRVAEREALVCGDRRFTYAQVEARANQLAHFMAAQGVGPGDHVGLYLTNCPEYVEALLAAYKLRAVPINVNYRFLADELDYIINNSDAEVLVFDRSLASIVEAARPRLTRVCLFVVVGETADTDASRLMM